MLFIFTINKLINRRQLQCQILKNAQIVEER